MQGTFISMFLIALCIVLSWELRRHLPQSWQGRIETLYILGGLAAWVYTLAYSLGMSL
jgi:hypothetical protein